MSWITALKLVPWTEVIAAAPHVVKTARTLLGKTQATPAARDSDSAQPLDAQVAATLPPVVLEHIAAQAQRIQALEARQQQLAEIAQNLAAQQEKVIETVSLLRTGATRLAWGLVVIGALATVALIATLARG